MPPISPDNPDRSVPVTPRLTFVPGAQWHGSASVAPPAAAVLGAAPDEPLGQLSLFAPAEPAIELELQPAPSAVLGQDDQQAALEYQPEEDAVYALLHAVQTPNGVVFDFTLPEATAEDGALVLGPGAGRTTLRFPVNPIVLEPAEPQAGVLGIEEFVGGAVGEIVLKRVLQVIKSPFDRALLDAIKQAEGEPRIVALRDEFQPLQGFEQWRALLPPGGERRVLLFVHGFGSSAERSSGPWLRALAPAYDAVLGYSHPTISRDPEQNARELLALIPDDLRLSVDLIAHSRGGLVARSLVELLDPAAHVSPRRLVTHGTPHAGTRLADPERWDRLVSLGMTAASWLAAATGAAVWVPKLLEAVLKAAAQSIFDLPGVGAMTPGGPFLARLNAAADQTSGAGQAQSRALYSTVTSRFSVFGVQEPGFRQAFRAFAAQAFIDAPNDLVVPTDSMSAIDVQGTVPPERQFRAAIDHFSYFSDDQVLAFLREQLQ